MRAALAISFVHPGLLGFLALAAIPVLIYLFNRRRYRVVRWAAMDFVLRALKKNQRRLRIENLLLLATRVLAIVLLVAAIARPVGQAIGPIEALSERRRNLAILIDTSYSMGYRQGAQTSFERAKKLARDLAEKLLRRGDRFALIAFAQEARSIYADPVFVDDRQKARILSEIQELEVGAAPTDLGRALAALARMLPRFHGKEGGEEAAAAGGVAKEVFILTDLQRSALAGERGLRDPSARQAAAELARLGAEITIVDCGAEDPQNVAVTALGLADEVAGVDIPVRVVATVKSFAPSGTVDASLDWFVDDLLQGSKPVSLEPGEEKEVELVVTFREKGAHRVHAVLKTDDLPIDNARYLAVEAREGIEVVALDGEPRPDFGESETDFLLAALAPAEDSRLGRENLFRPRALAEPALGEADLAGAGVVVVANAIALSDADAERLEAWVRRGGGVFFFLGPQVDAALWNEKLWKNGKGLLPAPVGEAVLVPEDERWFALGGDDFAHPALRAFGSSETRPLLGAPRFWGYRRLAVEGGPAADPSVSVLLRFEPRSVNSSGAAEPGAPPEAGGDPALVERRFGRGRALVFASTADGEWNNFYAHYAYLMLAQRAAAYLADAGAARRNLAVGEPCELVVPESEYAAQILVTTPAQDTIETTLDRAPDEPDHFRLVYADTARPGFYEVRFGGAAAAPAPAPRTEIFAANVEAAEEADLAKIDEKELRALLPELRARVEPDRGVERLLRSPQGGQGKDELWREALLAVLCLLALESGLALAFDRRAA